MNQTRSWNIFNWIGIRKIFRNRFNWTREGLEISSIGSASEKYLGIYLTGPEKAFDWIGIRKIFRNRFNWTRQGLGTSSTGSTSEKSLGIDLTGPEKAFDMAENLTTSFLKGKGKGQSYAMHDMDQAMKFST